MFSNGMHNLHMKKNFISRSICAENLTGEKGKGGSVPLEEGNAMNAARDLGTGWKVNPFIRIQAGETFTLADIEGPGAINHIWTTVLSSTVRWRNMILRIYWDNQEQPAVECPIGDFFFSAWENYAPVSTPAVCVNPDRAFNCYWTMPFRKHCRITLENCGDNYIVCYYQVDYCLGDIGEDALYFHAQFRRTNPLPYKEVYTILDGVKGSGQYVGTYMAWGVNNNGWWGEGEIKFYLDGDKEYPTICGTGTEDYFCGAYNFENKETHQYQEFATPYSGLSQVIRPDGLYSANTRFGLYRLHITDPITFTKDLKITIQALGWRKDGRYLPLQDDIASVAFWYQTLPTAPFPALPDKDSREVI